MEEQYNTIEYYNKNAETYFEQTVESNLQVVYDEFLSRIPANSYILDFGCGSGRDSKFFIENGYKVKAIDGSIEMCKLASKYINQDVECMKFEELDEENIYDGIWACSSIVHVEKEKLPNILNKMIKALKQNGVIFVSFKKGTGYEIKEGKYYNFLVKEEFEKILENLNTNVKIIGYRENISNMIGKFATVKHFGMTNTEQPVPNLPVWKALRIEKDI